MGYREDPDRIVALMRRVFEELRQDPAHGPLIVEPIEIFGVDAFKDATVVIKARQDGAHPAVDGGPGVPAAPAPGLRGRGRRGPGGPGRPGGGRGKPFPVLMMPGAEPLPR